MAQKGFCSDLCTGTERGFKGLTILFFIYGFASLLACLIISQLTRSHLDYDQDNTADYDGDGVTDLAVNRPSDGKWVVRRSSDASKMSQLWGTSGWEPALPQYQINRHFGLTR